MGRLRSWSPRSPIIAYRVYKNCRFAEYVSGWSGYKSSHISATIASIRSKFATEVPKALYFHNPALTQKKISPTYGPFSRGRSQYRKIAPVARLGWLAPARQLILVWHTYWHCMSWIQCSCTQECVQCHVSIIVF